MRGFIVNDDVPVMENAARPLQRNGYVGIFPAEIVKFSMMQLVAYVVGKQNNAYVRFYILQQRQCLQCYIIVYHVNTLSCRAVYLLIGHIRLYWLTIQYEPASPNGRLSKVEQDICQFRFCDNRPQLEVEFLHLKLATSSSVS